MYINNTQDIEPPSPTFKSKMAQMVHTAQFEPYRMGTHQHVQYTTNYKPNISTVYDMWNC